MVRDYNETFNPFQRGFERFNTDQYRNPFGYSAGDTVQHTVSKTNTLRTKHKPGEYSYLYTKSRPVIFDDYDLKTRLEIISRITWDDLDKSMKSLRNLELPDNFRYQIARFISALEYWYKYSEGDKIDHPRNIIKKFFMDGSKYTAYLDDLSKYAVQAFHMNSGIYYHETYDTEIGHNYNNYNYIPPLFIFPILKVDIEDWKYMLEEPKVDNSTLKDFEDAINTYVKVNISDIPDCDLYRPSTSSSREWSGAKDKFYRNILNYPKPQYAERGIVGYRTVIPISAENWRDAITLDIPSYFTMRKIDLLFGQILNAFPNSVTSNNPRLSKRRLERLFKHHRYTTGKGTYYMRDIKKSGLTMPIKQLGPIMRRVLTKKYPGKGFELIEALENLTLVLDDKGQTRVYGKRGLGLGMGNNIWTFIQCIVFYMVQECVDLPIDGLFGNDDCIYWIPKRDDVDDHESDLYQVIDIDTQICQKLGIVINTKKGCQSEYPIFYEEYLMPGFRTKSARYIANLGAVRTCSNIYEAKYLACSILSNTQLDLGPVLDELVAYWGYEFHPREKLFSYEMGGWYRKRVNGLSPALIDMYKHRDILEEIIGATVACQESINYDPEPEFDMFDTSGRSLVKNGIRLLKAIPKDKLGLTSFMFLSNKEVINYFDKIERLKTNISARCKRSYKLRRGFYKYRKKIISIPEARSEIVKKIKNLQIPDEEVFTKTREYDIDETVLSNSYGCSEKTMYDTLCMLHDEGYIDYEDRYLLYRGSNHQDVIANVYGKIHNDLHYEEYDEYCKNTSLILLDWILRHRQHHDWYPAIPAFYRHRTNDESGEVWSIRDIQTNCIIPLSVLYTRLRSEWDLRTVLDINAILLEYQEEWLESKDVVEQEENPMDRRLKCSTHSLRKKYGTFDEMIDLGYKIESGTIECEQCRKEALWAELYKDRLSKEREYTEEENADAMELAMQRPLSDDEELVQQDEEEIPDDTVIVEDEDEVYDDYEDEPNE